MAEAFAKRYGEGIIEASSAGTMPSDRVHPVVIQAMWEKGIDISSRRPRLINEQMIRDADVIVTMGCGVEGLCPAVLIEDKKIVEWKLEDPKGQSIQKVREIRDDVERNVMTLIQELSR
jgi:protein-tyrosine-phosphatase